MTFITAETLITDYNNNVLNLIAEGIIAFSYNKQTNKQTNFISYQLQYIEKHDHPTRMKISKMKNNVFKYKRLVANANKLAYIITYYNNICL